MIDTTGSPVTYLTYALNVGALFNVTVESVGAGGSATLLDMKKDIVKLLSHAGPWPGISRIKTGAVMAIFSSIRNYTC